MLRTWSNTLRIPRPFENYEQYHDGLRILLESDKGLYKAFGQSPRTKYLKTENFYLTSKERLTYMMGFIDAFVDNEMPYGRVPQGHPVIVDYFYHEEIRGTENTGKRNR